MNPLRRIYLRFLLPPNPFRMDPRLDRLVEQLCRDAPPGSHVLNLGAGRTSYRGPVVNFDLEAFLGVHVCGDGARLPFRSGSFSAVLLRGVLEHVRSPDAVMWEVERVLEAWGQVYIEVPFLQPFHASPEDYRRFTLPGLRGLLPGFEELDAGVQIGPLSTLTWIVQESIGALFAFGSPKLYRVVRTAMGWTTFWLKYLDRLIVPAPFVSNSASAVYFLGRKRG